MMKHMFFRVLRKKEDSSCLFSGFVQLDLPPRGTVVLQRRGTIQLK